MPNPAIATPQIQMTNQMMIRQGALGLYTIPNTTPPGQPQPLGGTPLWCSSALTGSSDQIFFEATTGRAIYFPTFAVALTNSGKPMVKFSKADKTKTPTQLEITLQVQGPTAQQTANAQGAPLSACPAAYYKDAAGNDTTTVQLNVGDNGNTHLIFDTVTPADPPGSLRCVVTIKTQDVLQSAFTSLLNDLTKPSQSASVAVTRMISAVGVFVRRVLPVDPPRIPVDPLPPIRPGPPFGIIYRLPPRPTDPYPPGTALYTLYSRQPVASILSGISYNVDLYRDDIAGDLEGINPGQGGYVPCPPVPGYDNPLFQNSNDSTKYYYLPDAFKIARRDKPPFYPFLNVTVSGTTLSDAQATLFLVAVPVINEQKRLAALDLLKKANPNTPITMEVLPTPANIEYGLFLPGSTPFVKRQAPVTLVDPLADSILFTSLDDFQAAFESLTAPVSQYLQGRITVPVGENKVVLPLIARADDFFGDCFKQTRSDDGSQGTIQLVLENAVESAVQVDALPIVATRVGAPVACSVAYDPPLDAKQGARIPAADDTNAAAALTATVTPGSGPVDPTLQLAIDVGSCHVVPDAAALLRAVLDPNVPVKGTRPITVSVPSAQLGGDADPAKKILSVSVNFQNGNTIMFKRPPSPMPDFVSPDKPGELNLTVFDYILRQGAATDSIRYKLGVTYASDGHTVYDSDWRDAPNDNFVLGLP
jgi:hypothetical protein